MTRIFHPSQFSLIQHIIPGFTQPTQLNVIFSPFQIYSIFKLKIGNLKPLSVFLVLCNHTHFYSGENKIIQQLPNSEESDSDI